MLIFVRKMKYMIENINDKKVGFTIGKFAPLHKGHQFLIETALKEMDEMIVIVYDTDIINVPILVDKQKNKDDKTFFVNKYQRRFIYHN